MKNIKWIVTLIAVCFSSLAKAQMVEVQGELKVTNVSQSDFSADVLVLDGNNVLNKRNALTLGVPSSGIILSLIENNATLTDAGFVKIGKYSLPFEQLVPSGSFVATNTAFAPAAMSSHSAVWTGDLMIIWDAENRNGGVYNPATDTWTAMNTTNSPSFRIFQSAVWTGTEMIVWVGERPIRPALTLVQDIILLQIAGP